MAAHAETLSATVVTDFTAGPLCVHGQRAGSGCPACRELWVEAKVSEATGALGRAGRVLRRGTTCVHRRRLDQTCVRCEAVFEEARE